MTTRALTQEDKQSVQYLRDAKDKSIMQGTDISLSQDDAVAILDLIDRLTSPDAAQVREGTQSLQTEQSTLQCDQARYVLDPERYKEFLDVLGSPPVPSQALVELLAKTPPWQSRPPALTSSDAAQVRATPIPVNMPTCKHGKMFLVPCPQCAADRAWSKGDATTPADDTTPAEAGESDPGPGPYVEGQSDEWKAAHLLPPAPTEATWMAQAYEITKHYRNTLGAEAEPMIAHDIADALARAAAQNKALLERLERAEGNTARPEAG